MAEYNNLRTHSNMLTQNESNLIFNKVFINPNFNKGATKANVQCIHQPNKVMHVNPKFPHTQNNKIYINPNFIQPNYNQEHNLTKVKCHPVSSHKMHEHIDTVEFIPPTLENKSNLNIPIPTTIKSRYCLVRHNEHKPIEPKVDEVKRTVKLNKYKSVRLKDVKKNLNTAKDTVKPNQLALQTIYAPKYNNINLVSNVYKARFKFVNHKIETPRAIVKNPPIKSPANLIIKNTTKSEFRRRLKYVKRNLKTNNIPCPLFKKYGKCLRNVRGNCEYLHDKKHVSICRKFLKGICHDKDCLLSHELTDKKMPTCYFYLQGMCTKEDCPYLHVKLNERTKVCADFIKGYCENGDKCLKRHINVRNIVKKETSLKRNNRSSSISKLKLVKSVQINVRTTSNASKNLDNNEKVIDHRYYTEHKNETDTAETCEIIKPSRCKLGTLPSFIKL